MALPADCKVFELLYSLFIQFVYLLRCSLCIEGVTTIRSKMYSFLTRGNAILTFTLTVLAAMTFCCFASTSMLDYKTVVNVSTVRVLVKNVPDYSSSREKTDLGFLTFNLEADLTPLMNWNCKQLFVYLTAEYETNDNKLNQVVLWDKIIKRGENAALNIQNMNTKYYFWDDGNNLRGHKNVTLQLAWNVISNAGLLPLVGGAGSHSFQFPTEYAMTRA